MEKEVSAKCKTKRILLRVGLGISGVLLVLLIIIAIVLNMVVTPKKITPILLNLSKEYINGEVNCESVDITFFSSFPDLGIRLQNGSISSEKDTLLAFDNFMAAVDPLAFLFRKQIIIHQLEVENADIYAHVDTSGKANWDIFISSDSTEASQDSSTFVLPELNIKKIRLQNVNLTYDNLQQDMFIMVDSLHMRLKGNLSKEHAELSLGLHTTGISSYYQGQTFSRTLPFSFRTTLVRDRILKTLAIERGTVKIGSLELKTSGILKQNIASGIADVDVDFSLNASSLADLIEMIPPHISDIPSKLIAGGKVESSGKLSGQLGKDLYPSVTMSMHLINGTLASVKHPETPFIEDFDADFSTLLDLSGTQPSSLKLNNLYLQTASSKLTVQGEFDDILTKPAINAQAKADINFTQMSQKLPLEGMTMGGHINFDVSVQCLLDDVLASNYGKINANGVVNIKDVKFNHDKEQFTFYTPSANMTLGTNTRDSMGEHIHESLLRCKIVVDTLNLNWKEELIANSSRVSVLLTTSEPKDSASIAPVTIGSRVSNMRLVMGDSIRMRGVQALGSVNIRPRTDIPSLPEISGGISIDTLMGKAYEIGGRISKASLKLKLTKQQVRQRNIPAGNRTPRDTTYRSADNSKLREPEKNHVPENSALIIADRNTGNQELHETTENRLPEGSMQKDSTQTTTSDIERVSAHRPDARLTRAQRDSLRQSRLDPTTNLSFRLESQEAKDLLRNWDISGSFVSNDISIRTPYFPIPIRMRESDMTFSSNALNLTKAHIRLGESDFTLNGVVEGIRRALMYNGKISAKMTLDADSLDFNELIRAAVAGSEYSTKSITEKDSISEVVLDNDNTITLANDTTTAGIFVVPRNLDVEFNTRIRNGKFSNVNIKNARGRIILRDQAIQFPRFMLNSDIGSTIMTMVYKAPDPKGAYLGLEVGVKRIDLKELIEAMPVIVEMAPMLYSFEGVVDCNITAITELDSLMNVCLPKTTASCFLSGQNLVLLDGETFSEISKTLMFKNKNKNLIDSMSVEMILEDEKLMIFPFQLTLDRYNVAVGGTQNLDMSFNYHITVLKSPVPFKLGLNISGTPDNMKIRPGKAKYKNLFTVAREKSLDSTTINLRREMDDKLRQSIQEIAGMELRQPMRRPKMEIPDSLKHNFFQLEDTTAVSLLPTGSTEIITDTIAEEVLSNDSLNSVE
ncbi:MAG: AsmA family protein [Tannerella sp.]|jgi:hypothetical protein|nr:AsmA family protein [Tannerella sp.]